jgi:transcriptional regulator with XRE-family HTH domain
MELKDKIQKIRKENGLTQEQFANALFVTRTAVSKWETGRGVPNIESLKLMANIYKISLDELLNANEIIEVAENENKENSRRYSLTIDSVLNICATLGLVLPLYKAKFSNTYLSVPLYEIGGWLTYFYWIFSLLMAVCGVLLLINLKSEKENFKKALNITGTILNAVFVLLLILSGQPYPAVLFFALLMMKGFFMVRVYGK